MRLFYGQASEYSWWDADGARHGIPQGEGCEQGDPLAPALFALGQHDGLQRALSWTTFMLPDSARAREAIDLAHTGIAANWGKTRVFNLAGGPAPPRVAELGPDVWRGDKPLAEHGFVALGTPIGTAEYTQAWGTDRLEMEETLLRQLPQMPDLQCAWLLLCYCAAPRANHALRTIPPTQSGAYAAAHDAAVWGTLQACLGEPAEDVACPARDIALLPAYLGGLGLAQAVRTAPAACWAAWADALVVLAARSPAFAAWTLRALSGEHAPACLREAADGRSLLVAEGWSETPAWDEFARGPHRARRTTQTSSSVNGDMDGSAVRRVLATLSSATTCCCPQCLRPPVRCCARKRARMRVLG